jgi:hypothetical protein
LEFQRHPLFSKAHSFIDAKQQIEAELFFIYINPFFLSVIRSDNHFFVPPTRSYHTYNEFAKFFDVKKYPNSTLFVSPFIFAFSPLNQMSWRCNYCFPIRTFSSSFHPPSHLQQTGTTKKSKQFFVFFCRNPLFLDFFSRQGIARRKKH